MRVSSVSHGSKQVLLRAGNDNAGTVRVGGAEISGSVGFPLAAGEAVSLDDLSPSEAPSELWELSETWVNAAVDDVVDVLFGGTGR